MSSTEIKPIVIEAWKCPVTGEVFTNFEKFKKHAKKVEAREKEKKEKELIRSEASKIMKQATDIDELFSEMGKIATRSKILTTYSGKPVSKIELRRDMRAGVSIHLKSDGRLVLSCSYEICVSSEHRGFGSELQYLFRGFESGSGGFSCHEWKDSDGKLWKNGYVCRYSCSFDLSVIPNISKKYRRFAELLDIREEWETDKSFVANLTPNENQEKIDLLKKEWDSIKQQIDNLLEKQREIGNTINSYNQEHSEMVRRLIDSLKKEDPFVHEEEYQELLKTRDILRLSEVFKKK